MISKLIFKISNKDSNKSISSFLSAFYLGKEKIYKLELNSCLFINDKKAFTRSILKENDILTIIIDEEINVAPCGDDLEVVYEDEHFLFVNKPKNMLVHDDGTKQEINNFQYLPITSLKQIVSLFFQYITSFIKAPITIATIAYKLIKIVDTLPKILNATIIDLFQSNFSSFKYCKNSNNNTTIQSA